MLNDRQKNKVKELGHSLYTVEYIEAWIDRKDNVAMNALAALNAMAVTGFMRAVDSIIALEDKAEAAVPEHIKKYLAAPESCPFCGKGNSILTGHFPLHTDDTTIEQIVECECGSGWVDVYKLTGIKEYPEGDKVNREENTAEGGGGNETVQG